MHRLFIVLAGVALTGCATMVTGTTDTMRLESVPTGTTVEIQGQVVTTRRYP